MSMKSMNLSLSRSLFVRLSVTCLLSAAFTLKLGYSEAGSILAHSPESTVNLPSGPEPVNPAPVTYRSFDIKGAEGKKSLAQLRSEIGEEKLAIALKLNRIDAQHLRADVTLVIPEQDADLITYSPFPHKLEIARDTPKLLLVSRRVQAFGAYEFGKLVRWGPTSTGKKATPTPVGLYHTNWKSKATRSSVNAAWLLPWYFNIDNNTGISFHQYDLPGYPASHGCIRLLADDGAWIYGWADQWTLSTDRRRVETHGTPVIVFGEYDYRTPAPWKRLVMDYCAASVTGVELDESLRRYLPVILQRASDI
ncbi:MAG TPA: L,D-transpeptidase [Blastocatellia bacterium]|nr:L,D-transpeptidase [Blastocatellia bacterium]